MHLLGLLVLAATSAEARPLTVDDAVRLALEHSYSVDAAQAGEQKARAEATEALLGMGPSVSVAGGYTRIDPVPQASFQLDDSAVNACDNLTEADAEEAGYSLEMLVSFCKAQILSMQAAFSEPMEMGLPDNYFVTGTIEQVIFAGGAMHQARRAARDAHRASLQQVRLAEHEVAYQAEELFYGLVAARRAVEVTGEALTMAERLVTDMQNLADVGMASKADLLAAEARLSQTRLDALKARHGLGIVERTTRVLLGLPPGEPLELVVTEVIDTLPLDAASLRTRAIDNRPDLASLRYTVDALDHAASATWASWLPAVVAQGNLNWRNPDYSLEPEWYRSTDITLAASWSIWDRGAALQKHRATKASATQLDSQRKLLAEMLDIEIASAIDAIREADEALTVAKLGLEQAEESYRLEKDSFDAGLANRTELLVAQTTLSAARLSLLQAETQRHLARAALRKAVGIDPEARP